MGPRAPKPDQQIFHVAMLKVVLQLKRDPQRSLGEITHEIAEQMKIDELGFKRFLAHYMPAFVKTSAVRT
ncbi:MAG: hypothetical protein IT381_29460 [Deltaproteobacteria bacterium]|nr:hypothetical protein [Deltaproteobacteria bacterium]